MITSCLDAICPCIAEKKLKKQQEIELQKQSVLQYIKIQRAVQRYNIFEPQPTPPGSPESKDKEIAE